MGGSKLWNLDPLPPKQRCGQNDQFSTRHNAPGQKIYLLKQHKAPFAKNSSCKAPQRKITFLPLSGGGRLDQCILFWRTEYFLPSKCRGSVWVVLLETWQEVGVRQWRFFAPQELAESQGAPSHLNNIIFFPHRVSGSTSSEPAPQTTTSSGSAPPPPSCA